MIIFATKLNKEFINGHNKDIIVGHRWVISTHWLGVELTAQYLGKSSNEWRHCGPYWSIKISSLFEFGSDHMWYDGPHCFFSLGFIHFAWRNNNCKKCLDWINDK